MTEEDANNVSRDDSEDFFEETAFFRATSAQDSLLSPIPSPSATPRVWSSNSLYGEALVQSTRPPTSNSHSSPGDERLYTFHSQQFPLFEDLLVSPASPTSETPTTPPSVANRPSLSPPPLILPELMSTQDNTLAPAAAPSSQAPLPLTTSGTAAAPESFSYTSRTSGPNRPPRAPNQPVRNSSATTNSAHTRQRSDNSFLSALTDDVSFGTLQTASTPPPRSGLPLPLLSASSSWGRWNPQQQQQQPLPNVADSVSGMNISVPADLLQPFLVEDDGGRVATTTNPSLARNRNSTPPRHRPPKNKSQSRTLGKLPRPKASSSSTQQQQQQRSPPAFHNNNKAGTGLRHHARPQTATAPSRALPRPNNTAFVPIPPTKPRSYSSDVVLLEAQEGLERQETQSLPGMAFVSTTTSPAIRPPKEAALELREAAINVEFWLHRAYSPLQISQTLELTGDTRDTFATALLAMRAFESSPEEETTEDPPMRKASSATSSLADNISSLRQEAKVVDKVPPATTIGEAEFPWSTAALGTLLSLVLGGLLSYSRGLSHWIWFLGFHQPLVIFLSIELKKLIFLGLKETKAFSEGGLPGVQIWICVLESQGWPTISILWAALELGLHTLSVRAQWLSPTFAWVSVQMSWAALTLGCLATARCAGMGYLVNHLLYQRFRCKVQRMLRRVVLVRRLSKYATGPVRGNVPAEDMHFEAATPRALVGLGELVAFRRACVMLQSSRSLSLEIGSEGMKADRTKASGALFDALAVQGQVPFTALKQACQGSENLVSQMFTSSTEGLVTRSDFIASIEALYQGINGLSQSIHNTADLMRSLETFIAFAFNLVACFVALGVASILPSIVSIFSSVAVGAVVVASCLSSFSEGIGFAIFSRPFDCGDLIILNPVIGVPIEATSDMWKVERVGLWRTSVLHESREERTSLSNSTLARCHLTVLDGAVPARVRITMKFSAGAPKQKVTIFRKAMEEYVRDNRKEWIHLISMDAIKLDHEATDYEVFLRHRQPANEVGLVRESRMNLLTFCHQAVRHLQIGPGEKYDTVATTMMNTYNDDLSEDSMLDASNELYFLTNVQQNK